MTSESSHSTVIPALTVVALSLQTGCIFPVAAWLAPEVGSGQELRFYETDGDPIEKDGLLIVHRDYGMPFGVRGAPSNHVVEIRRGRAKVPHEWAVWSFWLSVPLLPYSSAWPGNNLELIPFIPGYAAEGVPAPRLAVASPSCSDDGSDRAIVVPKWPGRGWENCLLRLIRRFEKKREEYLDPDLRLPHYQYFRVKRFIKAELRRFEIAEKSSAHFIEPDQPKRMGGEQPRRGLAGPFGVRSGENRGTLGVEGHDTGFVCPNTAVHIPTATTGTRQGPGIAADAASRCLAAVMTCRCCARVSC